MGRKIKVEEIEGLRSFVVECPSAIDRYSTEAGYSLSWAIRHPVRGCNNKATTREKEIEEEWTSLITRITAKEGWNLQRTKIRCRCRRLQLRIRGLSSGSPSSGRMQNSSREHSRAVSADDEAISTGYLHYLTSPKGGVCWSRLKGRRRFSPRIFASPPPPSTQMQHLHKCA